MVIAADHVVGADRAVGRGKIRDVLPLDLDRFLLGLALLDPRGPRSGEAGTEQHAVAGLEEEADRRAVLHQEIGADHRHVGNHRAAEHAGKLGLLQDELVLDPLVLLIVQAAHGDQVLQVAAPSVERVLEPEEVLEAAEADVEELGGHVPGDGLDLRPGRPACRRGRRRLRGNSSGAASAAAGSGWSAGSAALVKPSTRSCSMAVRMPSLPGQAAQLLLELPIARLFLPLPRQRRGSIAGRGC